MENRLEAILKERILILDGAMGTMIQRYGLQEDDFRGDKFQDVPCLLKGNNDVLSLTRPDVIEDIHRKYLAAGADMIETNTFNAQRVSQEDYGCQAYSREMNRAACALARKVADEFTRLTPEKPRFVAGSIGPTNKTCSLSTDVNHPEWRAITFDELVAAYSEQISELLQGGVDALLIETIFDTLNAKAALYAARQEQERLGRNVPVMLSVTIADKGGHTLSGQNLQAFLTSIEFAKVFSVGLNCSFGPDEMKPFLRELAAMSPYYVSVYPNAGLPNAVGEYDILPDRMAELMREFVDERLVNIIGGCCGTTDEYIARYPTIIKNGSGGYVAPRLPMADSDCLKLSGLERLELRPEIKFVNIGERCNVAGSKKFLRLISNHEYEEAMGIARKQVEDGAQVIDINMDDALLDAQKEMVAFINMLASDPVVSRVPIMIDSSNWDVIVDALKCVQGKCIVNSISLKEGEEKFLDHARVLMNYGAAVVVMAFDEEGQACTYERKVQVCERAYRLLVDEVGYDPKDIIFDPNVLSIATGMAEHDNYAVNFIEATGWIRQNLPHAHVSGGVSNLSFSFRGNNYIREAMHAVFLYHAIGKGMDMGIVNPASKVMYDEIPALLRDMLENLVLNRTPDAADKLLKYISEAKDEMEQRKEGGKDPLAEWKGMPLEERLRQSLMKGKDDYLESDLNEAITYYGRAVEIIEGPLMEGMGIVGQLFAQGKMFLPQVVRTAKTMQKAVAILSPYMIRDKKDSAASAGKILMATVKGDVHDIGKNIVGVVLTCNNFEIVDLGVMVTPEKIVEEALAQKVDMIGLCGLITPSLQEMINTVHALNEANISIPVIIGGATTSELHTALKIAPAYNGPVIWSKDAAQTSIVAATLMNAEKRESFLQGVADKYEHLRANYQPAHKLRSLEEVRKNKLDLFS